MVYNRRRIALLYYIIGCIALLIGIHFYCWLLNIYRYSDENYAASRIRDDEELRYAHARTIIYEWSSRSHMLPFNYLHLTNTGPVISYHKLSKPIGLTFTIMSSSRLRTQVDNYNPQYLIESLVNLIKAIYHDVAMYGKRFDFIRINACLLTNFTGTFENLNVITKLLGRDSIRTCPDLDSSLSLPCQSVLGTAYCLFNASVSTDFVVLLEDDMIPEMKFLNQLWNIFVQLDRKNFLNDNVEHNFGAIQLHQPVSYIRYSFLDWSSIVELFSASSLLTFIFFLIILRRYCSSFYPCSTTLLLISSWTLSCLIVGLFGRLRVLHLWYTLFQYQSLTKSSEPSAYTTGAASLFNARQARDLGRFLRSAPCDKFLDEAVGSKQSQLISAYLNSHDHIILSTFPNLFKHRGLYTLYGDNRINPRDVE